MTNNNPTKSQSKKGRIPSLLERGLFFNATQKSRLSWVKPRFYKFVQNITSYNDIWEQKRPRSVTAGTWPFSNTKKGDFARKDEYFTKLTQTQNNKYGQFLQNNVENERKWRKRTNNLRGSLLTMTGSTTSTFSACSTLRASPWPYTTHRACPWWQRLAGE